MRFTIRTELEDEHELRSLNEIEWAVDRLESEPGSFLCIEPESPIDGITYLQAAYIRKTKGLFRKKTVASYYQVEVQEKKPNGDLYQYCFDTNDREMAAGIICAFYESKHFPDLSKWECELFYKAEE